MADDRKAAGLFAEKIKKCRRGVSGRLAAAGSAAALLLLAAWLTALVAAGIDRPPLAAAPPPVNEPAAASPAGPKAAAASGRAVAPAAVRPLLPPPWPLSGTVAAGFGWREHPVYKDWRYHPGVDIEAPAGAPVAAIRDGRVQAVGRDAAYGLTVRVASGPYTVYYGSLGRADVRPQETIRAGERVGAVGVCSGEPGAHLHLAVQKDGVWIDPSQTGAAPR